MTGQSTTSSRQEKANQTTTSTISNHYADRVMEENKTGYYKGLHGAVPATNRGGVMGVGVAILRALNDLLPYNLRPIKSKRRAGLMRWGWGAELYYWRRRWHSHGKYEARSLLNKIQWWNQKR